MQKARSACLGQTRGNRSLAVLANCVIISLALVIAGCSSEKGEWEEAQALNTEAAYRAFLEAHPAGKYEEEARAMMTMAREWGGLSADSTTAEDVSAFITRYPDGPFAEEAKSKLVILQELEDWGRLLTSEEPAEYEEFIEKYKDGTHAAEAKSRVILLKRIEDIGRISSVLTVDPSGGTAGTVDRYGRVTYEPGISVEFTLVSTKDTVEVVTTITGVLSKNIGDQPFFTSSDGPNFTSIGSQYVIPCYPDDYSPTIVGRYDDEELLVRVWMKRRYEGLEAELRPFIDDPKSMPVDMCSYIWRAPAPFVGEILEEVNRSGSAELRTAAKQALVHYREVRAIANESGYFE